MGFPKPNLAPTRLKSQGTVPVPPHCLHWVAPRKTVQKKKTGRFGHYFGMPTFWLRIGVSDWSFFPHFYHPKMSSQCEPIMMEKFRWQNFPSEPTSRWKFQETKILVLKISGGWKICRRFVFVAGPDLQGKKWKPGDVCFWTQLELPVFCWPHLLGGLPWLKETSPWKSLLQLWNITTDWIVLGTTFHVLITSNLANNCLKRIFKNHLSWNFDGLEIISRSFYQIDRWLKQRSQSSDWQKHPHRKAPVFAPPASPKGCWIPTNDHWLFAAKESAENKAQFWVHILHTMLQIFGVTSFYFLLNMSKSHKTPA